jgi:hypothetical protein
VQPRRVDVWDVERGSVALRDFKAGEAREPPIAQPKAFRMEDFAWARTEAGMESYCRVERKWHSWDCSEGSSGAEGRESEFEVAEDMAREKGREKGEKVDGDANGLILFIVFGAGRGLQALCGERGKLKTVQVSPNLAP